MSIVWAMNRSFKYYLEEFQTSAQPVASTQNLEGPANDHIDKYFLDFVCRQVNAEIVSKF
jgi:hypothetical protein